MRILLCHNRYATRSGEDVAYDFVRELFCEAGHYLDEILVENSSIARFGIVEKTLLPVRAIHSISSTRTVREHIRCRRPDVAVVQNVFPLLSPAIYGELRRAGIPVVQMIFNYRLLCLNGQFFTQGQICERCLRGTFMNGVVRRCFRNSAALSAMYAASLGLHRWRGTFVDSISRYVVPDEFLKGKLITGGFPAESIEVVPNPMRVRSEVAAAGPHGYGLFVGRLLREKGVLTLLDAALLLKTRVPLKIAGDGEALEAVRRHPAVVSGKVEFLGPKYGVEFERLLAQASFVVVPSEWYDNLPMIVCQAFDQAKPVIASRINGIPEFVRHGHNGFLFSPGSAKELAACIDALYSNPELWLHLSHGARDTAVNQLAPMKWIDRMNRIFLSLLPRGESA